MNVPGANFIYKELQSAAVATGDGSVVEVTNLSQGSYSALTLQVRGISGDTITFETTNDGTNWGSIQAKNLATSVEATTATADGFYRIICIGLSKIRARISTYSAGTIYVYGNLTA